MARLEGIEHIFFDLDHTLWDFDKNSALAFRSIFEKNKITVPVNEFLEVYKPINFKYWKYYREARVTKEELRYGRLYNSFKELKVSIDDHLINRLSQDYIAYLPLHNYLFDNVKELLEELKNKYVMHIITNGFEEVQHLKLERSGIAQFFTTVTTSEKAAAKKPDPKIFKRALSDAGAHAHTSVMVGDNYEADVQGAQAIGMQAICFNYHKTKLRSDDMCINSIQELRNYL